MLRPGTRFSPDGAGCEGEWISGTVVTNPGLHGSPAPLVRTLGE